jgi:hypothetical protein
MSAVAPFRDTASSCVSSSEPGSWLRWMMSSARSRESKGLFSCHLTDPARVIFLAMGERSAPTRSVSGSLVRV